MKKIISLFTAVALTTHLFADETEGLPAGDAAPVAESPAPLADEAQADAAAVPVSTVLSDAPIATPQNNPPPIAPGKNGRSMSCRNWIVAGAGLILVAVGSWAVSTDSGKNSPGH